MLLGLAVPAQAQLRTDINVQQAPVKLYDSEASGFNLNSLFSPEHFKMHHSVEFTASSFGGHSASMGMYTNTMMWQFNQKLAARVDVGVAQPFGGSAFNLSQGQGQMQPQVFLRNAEVSYRPSENVHLHFSVQQNPYGYAMNPYYYSPYGYGSYMRGGFGLEHRDLFWNDRLR